MVFDRYRRFRQWQRDQKSGFTKAAQRTRRVQFAWFSRENSHKRYHLYMDCDKYSGILKENLVFAPIEDLCGYNEDTEIEDYYKYRLCRTCHENRTKWRHSRVILTITD